MKLQFLVSATGARIQAALCPSGAPKQKSCFGKTEEISVLTRGVVFLGKCWKVDMFYFFNGNSSTNDGFNKKIIYNCTWW